MADSSRSERPLKRLRRLSTEDDSEDGNSSAAPTSASRPRRAAASSGTTIERSSPDDARGASIRLTVKSDPKKLQQVTRGPITIQRSGRNAALPDPAEIVSGPRQGRKKAIVEESSDEEDDDDQQTPAGYGDDDEEEEEISEDEDAVGEEDEDEDMDAEGEEDEDMIDVAPPVHVSAPKGKAAKLQVTITPAQELPSVEDKEMAMDDDDDDELSSLDDEDAEGELDDEMGEEDAEGEEDEDSDEDISASASRGDTPDLSKLTRRQRGQFEDVDGSLLALSNEAQKKKHLTAEEHAMRRTEMARRRKNLSEKRNEEEKMDTINRLLKKQAPKRRSKAEKEADRIAEEEGDPERVVPKANPVFSRYILNASGPRLAIPEDWEGAPFGPYLENAKLQQKTAKPYSGRLVEEDEDKRVSFQVQKESTQIYEHAGADTAWCALATSTPHRPHRIKFRRDRQIQSWIDKLPPK